MVMDAVAKRFVEQSPITVMARVALQRALEPEWIDALFEREREQQCTRELLFSTTVELMSVVAAGMRPSVHAAAKACKDLPVSVQAVYDKIKWTEPALVRGLVQGSAKQLAAGYVGVEKREVLQEALTVSGQEMQWHVAKWRKMIERADRRAEKEFGASL
jgi:hypothetical protein